MREITEDFEVTAILHQYKYYTPILHLPSSNLKARLPTQDFKTFTKAINNSTSLRTANILMATLHINKDQLFTGGNRVFAQDFTKAADRSITLPSSNKKMSYSQIGQVQTATVNKRVFGQDFSQAITGRAMTLPSTNAKMATLPINKHQLITGGNRVFAQDFTKASNRSMTFPSTNTKMASYSQIIGCPSSSDNKRIFAQDWTKGFNRSMTLPSVTADMAALSISKEHLVTNGERVFAQDFTKTIESSTPVTKINAEQADSQSNQDQPASSGGSGKRVYSCNSVIVCMSKLSAFETDAEKSYCEKHHIAEALEEIYHTAEKEQGGKITDKDRKKYSKKFRWGQFRKSPAYGHDHEKCDCGCCVRLGAYLGKVQAALAKEEGRRLGLWTVFTMRRQFGIKLNKKGLIRGRVAVAGSE